MVALSETAGDEVAELLLRALGDEDWRVRKEAVRVATALAQPLALLPDAHFGGGPRRQHRFAQRRHRGARGARASGRARRAPRRRSTAAPSKARKFLVAALGAGRGEAVVAALADLVHDADTNLAAAGVDALASIGGEESVRVLRACLGATDAYIRLAALDGLERLDAALSWDELSGLLSDRLVRRVALRALGHTGSSRAVPACSRLSRSRRDTWSGAPRRRCIDWLPRARSAQEKLHAGVGRLGESARSTLRALFAEG